MNAVFDYFNRKQTPALLLCNPYLEPVASLGASFNVENTIRYNALSELEFDFPQSSDNGITKFSAYAKIQIKMVVLVEGVGYYIITECPEETEGSIPTKHVVCQSLEAELMYKRMFGLSGTFNFYSDESPHGTLLDTIIQSTQGWSLDYVDPDLINVYRTFDTNNMTLYNFMMSEMEKAFSCVFTFDTLNKKISAYSIANLNDEVNVYLSFENLNKSVTMTQYSDEIATVLYCYGDGSVDIRGVNPLGTNAIYNFEYYMNSNWMSDDLIQAITAWDNKVNSLQETSASYTTQRNSYLTTLVGKRNEFSDLNIVLSSYQTELEAYKAMPVQISGCIVDLENKIKDQKVEIKKKRREIYQAQNNMDNKNSELLKIANQLKFTGQYCWQDFVGNISSSITKITNINKNWRGVYYIGADLDDAQYYAFLDDIGKALYNASTTLSKLLSLAKSNTKNYFSLTIDDVIIVRNYLYKAIDYIQESYDLFSHLIQYTAITNQLSAINILLNSYIDIIDYPTNFSQSQFTKLQTFMFENTYTNKNVVITSIMSEKQIQRETQSLYNQAQAVLSRVSTPRYEFEGDFVNFLSLPEYQSFIDELELGKIVTIELGGGEKVKAALLEIVYTYDNPIEFQLVFSNRVKLNNSNFKFADLFIETTNDAIGLSGVGGGTTYQTTNNTSVLNPYSGANSFQPPTSLNNFLSISENEDEEEPIPTTTLDNSNLLSLDNAMISKLGYISFGVEPPSFYGNNTGAWLGFENVAKISLYSSETDYLQWDGYKLLIQARNFTLDSAGNITATSASLSGKISSNEGDIGGWIIRPTSLTSGSENNFVSLNSSGSNPSFSAGSVVLETAPFRVYPDGRLVATSASISGCVTAVGGTFGGWNLSASSLYAGSEETYVALASTGNPAIYAGSANQNTAPFRVYGSGCMVATNANITGAIIATSGSIGNWQIFSGSIIGGTLLNTVTLSTTGGSTPAFSAGSPKSYEAPFRVYQNGEIWATSASISGAITATSGCIGGWKVGSTSLYAGTGVNAVGMETSSGCPAFYAGNESGHSAPFKVYPDGSMYGTSGSIGGNRLATDSVSSSSFTSGVLGSGWRITSTGDAEFQNLIARGMIKTSVFQKDTISAVNGIVLISKSDVLAFDMTALDSATLTVTGSGTAFVANEIIRMKDGTNDEWLRITSASAAPTYHVVRDVIVPRTYAVNNNPAWKKGTTVASLGVGAGTKTGYIVLDSSSTNSPYIDVYGRNTIDISASGTTLHGRYGYLGGISDGDVGLDSTDVWGLYTDNAYIKGAVVATSGCVGKWNISSGSIIGGILLNTVTLSTTGGSTPAISAGSPKSYEAPFRVYQNGEVWATSASITGTINSTSGNIGGWLINNSSLYSGLLSLNGSGSYIQLGNASFSAGSASGSGIWMGKATDGNYKFYMGTSASYLAWGGSSLSLYNVSLDIDGISPHIAVGNPPPTSPSVGTGIWIDRNGLRSMSSGGSQIYICATDGKFYAGGSTIIIDEEGLNFYQPYETSSSVVGAVKFSSINSNRYIASMWGREFFFPEHTPTQRLLTISTEAIQDVGSSFQLYSEGGYSSTGATIDIRTTKYTSADESTSIYKYIYMDTESDVVQFHSAGISVNADGEDLDSYIMGSTSSYLLYCDAGNNMVGIKDDTPSYTLDVNGTFRAVEESYFDSAITVSGSSRLNKLLTTGSITNNSHLYNSGSLTVLENTQLKNLITTGSITNNSHFYNSGSLTVNEYTTLKNLITTGSITNSLDFYNSGSLTVIGKTQLANLVTTGSITNNLDLYNSGSLTVLGDSSLAKVVTTGSVVIGGYLNVNNYIYTLSPAPAQYNVGILQPSPTYTLDVNGTLRVVNGAQFDTTLQANDNITTLGNLVIGTTAGCSVVTGGTQVIADGALGNFVPNNSVGLMLIHTGAGNSTEYALFSYNTANTNIYSLLNGSNTVIASGSISVATAPTGKLTITSCSAPASIYIVNRRGGSRTARWNIFAASN